MSTALTESCARGAQTPPLIEQTIGAFFDAMVARFPEREALVVAHQGRRYSYRQLQQDAHRLASALLRLGLKPGERIGIWSHNNAEWVLMQLATAKAGLVLVNINPAYRTAEVEYALNKVGCRLLASGDPQDPRLAQVARLLHPQDAINIQFTSGTTGFPKGATLTHRNILNNGFFIGEAMKLTEQDRLCIPVPLYHCFGMVLGNLAVLTHGGCIVYPNDAFDPLTVLQTVQDEKCTGLHGVPTMFIAELDHPRFKEFDLSSLRTGIMAGSPCPIEVMKRVQSEMNMGEVTIAYGMTETSPVSCQSSTDTPLDKRVSTVGLVQPHLEIKIIDPETGRTVPVGERGEFCTRGYSVMQGYWEDPQRTAEAIDAEGWMHTGDLATMDGEGYVNIVGRIKDMVIRGGENVYPREIEEFLYRHPKVQDVQVVGVPDQKFGEELCAWIIVKPGQQLTDAEVREFCKGKIAHYKVPRYLKFVPEFPMTVTGKIQKFKIREAMVAELGLVQDQTA